MRACEGLLCLTLDNQVGSEDTYCANSNTRLSRSVRSTKASKYNSCHAAHGAEEWL